MSKKESISNIISRKFDLFLNRVSNFLLEERELKTLLILSILLSSIFVANVIGWGFISGNGDFWQNPIHDPSSYVSGLSFFLEDSWRFPIFDVARMNYPDSGSVIYTDSIPFIAFFAKVFRSFIADGWHYFGYVFAITIILNAMSFNWLLFQLGARNLLTPFYSLAFMTFASFILKAPIWYALSSHFFIIFSFIFYFQIIIEKKTNFFGYFIIMLFVSSLWHAYIFAMSASIFFATLAQSLQNKNISLKRFVCLILYFLLGLVVIIYVSGHFYYDIKMSHSFPLFGHYVASNTFSSMFGGYGRHRFFQYLGLGFVILLLFLFWFCNKTYIKYIKHHIWLFVVIVSCALLSLCIADQFLKNFPEPIISVFEIFRMSSRFIWPSYYLISALFFVILLKNLRSHKVLFIYLILFVSIIQISDNSFYLKNSEQHFKKPLKKYLDWNQWNKKLKGKEKVFVYPSFPCANHAQSVPLLKDHRYHELSREFYQMAARNKLISNGILIARIGKDCLAEKHRAETGIIEKNSIYVYLQEDGEYPFKPPKECLDQGKEFEYGIYCEY